MALIKCKDCQQDVSTDAKTCPACGAKVRVPTTSRTRIFFGALIASLIIAGVMGQHDADTRSAAAAAAEAAKPPEQKAAELAEQKRHATQIAIGVAGALALRDTAKDPLSFSLTEATLFPDGTVCYDYRAKNSFGAILPSAAVLTSAGKMRIKDNDGNAFVAAWNKGCAHRPGGSSIRYEAQARLNP